MRLFVAIQLADDMKKTIAGTLHTMKQKGVRGNYVPLQNLHLTVAFIGETNDPGAVKDALAGISFKPFELTIDPIHLIQQFISLYILCISGRTQSLLCIVIFTFSGF